MDKLILLIMFLAGYFYYCQKRLDMVVIITMITIVFLYNKNNKIEKLDNESIQNIASIYNDKLMKVNKIECDEIITKKITSTNGGKFGLLEIGLDKTNDNIKVPGRGTMFWNGVTGNFEMHQENPGKSIIADFDNFEGKAIQRLNSFKHIGGFAIDGEGTTMLLEEGKNNLTGGAKYDAWTHDRWDIVYIFKGWKITFWPEPNFGGNPSQVIINKDEDVKKITLDRVPGIGANNVEGYLLEWIGY